MNGTIHRQWNMRHGGETRFVPFNWKQVTQHHHRISTPHFTCHSLSPYRAPACKQSMSFSINQKQLQNATQLNTESNHPTHSAHLHSGRLTVFRTISTNKTQIYNSKYLSPTTKLFCDAEDSAILTIWKQNLFVSVCGHIDRLDYLKKKKENTISHIHCIGYTAFPVNVRFWNYIKQYSELIVF